MKAKLAFFTLLAAPTLMFAQTSDVFYNNGNDIYIQENSLIEVQGNIVNRTGSINNDGTIELSGDFQNDSTASFKTHTNSASKERTVKFIGSGTQAIKGDLSNPSSASFYNLVIDKGSETSVVEMQTDVVVNGSLVFGTANLTGTYDPDSFYNNNNRKGLLKTFDSNNEYLLDIKNGNPDAIAGYPVLQIEGNPTTGFILTKGTRGSSAGGLQRAINSATSYLFPVGTEGKGFNGVMLNFLQVPGSGSIKAKFCEGSSNPEGHVGTISSYCNGCLPGLNSENSGYSRYLASNPCNSGAPQWLIFDKPVANHGYWSFESSNSGYHYDMEVFPNAFSDVTADRFGAWRVLKHEDEYGVDPSLPSVDWRPEIESLISGPDDLTTFTRNMGCYNGNGVPGGVYSNFSHFTMGMSHGGGALPVKLLFVKADPIGKHRVRVSWATSLEIDNDGFEVERSTDGVSYTKIGWVEGHDNSTETNNYYFDDRVSDNILYYYRLKQIDNDRDFEYSQVVTVKLGDSEGGGGADYTMFPNPTSNEVFVTVDNPAEELTVQLFDIKGKLVYDNIFPVEQPGVSKTVNVPMASILPSGTYILTATTNGTRFSKQVILQ